LSNWWSYSISTGASAAVFGLIGSMIGLGFRSKTSTGSALREHYGRWAVYGLIMSFGPFMRIDIAAHVGGLVAGFVIGYLADRPKLSDTAINKLWKFAASACVVIVLCSFALAMLTMGASR
ncbi:MAG TPA: rhomboid family intramembrane serine protease, partial [Bryobacteraceae bacterium]|nr:rhomboid family intramembrane serine protease [Bryobacteraceae bacterium]